MKMSDIKVGEHYALGIERKECVVISKGVRLPYYRFKGIEVAIIREGNAQEHVSIPSREIVCTWEEHLADEAEQTDKAYHCTGSNSRDTFVSKQRKAMNYN